MTRKRNYRPSVSGLEHRLALNGAMGAAGLLSHVTHGAAEVHAAAPMAHHGGGHTHHGGGHTHHGGGHTHGHHHR